jgi:hypothetical protein
MGVRYLFYVGMAKENEGYLDLPRPDPVDHLYAGICLKVNDLWIPDFVEATLTANRTPAVSR